VNSTLERFGCPPRNSNPDMLIQKGICLARELVRGGALGTSLTEGASERVEGMFPYSLSRKLLGTCLCDTAGINR
jgi:hypothetical protein